MKKLLAIGEALIDFIPLQSGCALKEVMQFQPIVGGAPANVCGAFVKLGGKAQMITQLGADAFGDKIVDEFQKYGIVCDSVLRTEQANTSLAFVALKQDGNREFSFYRKPGADMLLSEEKLQSSWFEGAFGLHFCSVSLGDFPMKQAHKRAIELALSNRMLISFDPNVRLPLWERPEDLKKVILEFLPYAHVVKISDEELEFITGTEHIEQALPKLLSGNTQLVIYTKGKGGAEAYTRKEKISVCGKPVIAVDTTGAGDAFIGSLLFQMCQDGITCDNLEQITEEKMKQWLTFSNEYCSKSVQRYGAIASYPSMEEMK